MDTDESRPTSAQVRANVITQGRAYVQLIEAADVLLRHQPFWTERLLLRLVRFLYTHRLRSDGTEKPSWAAYQKNATNRGGQLHSLSRVAFVVSVALHEGFCFSPLSYLVRFRTEPSSPVVGARLWMDN